MPDEFPHWGPRIISKCQVRRITWPEEVVARLDPHRAAGFGFASAPSVMLFVSSTHRNSHSGNHEHHVN